MSQRDEPAPAAYDTTRRKAASLNKSLNRSGGWARNLKPKSLAAARLAQALACRAPFSMTHVFISWSGDLSQQLAEAIRQWLPAVLQFVRPYFTPDDIEKGARWSSDIAAELASCDVGLICLTASNTQNPWILFEAGALSKSLETSKVCTILFDIKATDVTGPLTIFQHTKFDRADFERLVRSINQSGGDAKLDDDVVANVFDVWWPRLEEEIKNILAADTPDTPTPHRTEREVLDEVLELTRLNAHYASSSSPSLNSRDAILRFHGSFGPGIEHVGNALDRGMNELEQAIAEGDEDAAAKAKSYITDRITSFRSFPGKMNRFLDLCAQLGPSLAKKKQANHSGLETRGAEF